jgi:hypothetical protein
MNINNTIKGHLDIFSVTENEDNSTEILIHGDPDGLRSLARILLELAEHNQEIDTSLPIGSREHTTLNPDIQLSQSSDYVTIGRLDAKGTHEFYERYIQLKTK